MVLMTEKSIRLISLRRNRVYDQENLFLFHIINEKRKSDASIYFIIMSLRPMKNLIVIRAFDTRIIAR